MSVRGGSPARVHIFTIAVALLLSAGCANHNDASIVRTTTAVAGVEILGVDRDTRRACAPPSAPDSSAGRSIAASGGVEVPADPQRIVVLDTRALDAACALGLWSRVVGAATLAGSRPQPRYLGAEVETIPGIGLVGAPDPDRIRALRPDLIIGSGPSGAATLATLSSIAPTVFTGSAGGWQQQFLAAAAAMNRDAAGRQALADYRRRAAVAGGSTAPATAAQAEVSVLRISADAITVEGADSFAGQVLADVGVGRSRDQRGASYRLNPDRDLDKAEGDETFVILDGEQGRAHAEQILDSDAWRDLDTADDQQVFAVDGAVWDGGSLAAATALVDDLTGVRPFL
jgi:iron complex transport system substrate-binding protein